MVRQFRCLAPILAVVMIVLAGCGGHKSAATPTPSPTFTVAPLVTPPPIQTPPLDLSTAPRPGQIKVIGHASYTVECSSQSIKGGEGPGILSFRDSLYPNGVELDGPWEVNLINSIVGPKYVSYRIGALHADESPKWYFRAVVYDEIFQRSKGDHDDIAHYTAPISCQLHLAKGATVTSTTTSA